MSATKAPPVAAVITPRHNVDEGGPVRTLTLPAWTIVAEVHPMSNATQLDALDAELKMNLPEMTFGANRINLKHRPSGWQYEFSTKEALRGVKNGPMEEGDGAVKVKHADEWMKSRTNMNTDIPIPDAIPIKSYDWTYTTVYEGHVYPESSKVIRFQDADHSNHSHSIPMDELARHDPILFYAQTLLFEDELHDNGSSSLLVRLRVMPGCIFLLSRLTLRVDHVLFRTFDTRLYHSFHSSPPLMIRETVGLEAPYDYIRKRLPDPDDLTPLTDATFVANTLVAMSEEEKKVGAGTGWRGIGTRVQVAVLDRTSGVTDALKDLNIS